MEDKILFKGWKSHKDPCPERKLNHSEVVTYCFTK